MAFGRTESMQLLMLLLMPPPAGRTGDRVCRSSSNFRSAWAGAFGSRLLRRGNDPNDDDAPVGGGAM
uniref:Putative secreted protein n=1 Tax=Anopheles triannulatus TaxID=58253 RepID=A0A2M4B6D6_9DIPT